MKRMLALILGTMMILGAILCSASAEDGLKDCACEEDKYSTKIPAGAAAVYDQGSGLTVYTGTEGYIPYVIIQRRPPDMKFKDPANYLNNVYREYMEEKYTDNYLGMIGIAKAGDIGGKQLLTAEYRFKIGDTTVVQLKLIEVREAGDVEYSAKYIDGQGEATLAALDAIVRYYRETDTAEQEPKQAAGSDVLKPADVSNTLVDRQNGTIYLARVTDTDRIMSGGYFTVELYVNDYYALDKVYALQKGDRVQVNGKVWTVDTLMPEEDGRRELRVQEDFGGYIAFQKHSKTACTVLMNDCTICTKISTEKVMMPLANEFTFIWLQGEEDSTTYDADGFVTLMTDGETAGQLTQYNTMARFDGGLLTRIGHQDYPVSPEY